MKCPICSAWTLVKDTRKRENNITVRRYECANLHTFKTAEQVSLVLDAKAKEQLRQMRIDNIVRASRSRRKATNV